MQLWIKLILGQGIPPVKAADGTVLISFLAMRFEPMFATTIPGNIDNLIKNRVWPDKNTKDIQRRV